MKGTRRPQKKSRKGEGKDRDRDAALLLLSVCFLLGAAGGILLGRLFPGGEIGAMLWQSADLPLPPLWLEVWSVGRWPAALLLLSFLPMRGGTIPTLFFLRGALLSYCVSALAGNAGLRELVGTGIVLGPTCLFTVPVLFLLGTESLMQAAGERSMRALLGRVVLCLPLLALAILAGQTLVPSLLSPVISGAASGPP